MSASKPWQQQRGNRVARRRLPAYQRAAKGEKQMQQKQMGVAEWGMLLVLSLLWGGSFLFNGILVKSLPPFTIVTGRVLIAALALNVIVRVTGHVMPHDRASWAAFFGMGILNNMIPFCLIVWGQTHILLGAAVLGEQLQGKHLVGMAMIAIGLAAIDGRLLARLRKRLA
jgi:drug/metabolite transporter (DMT)-like permease